MAISVRNIARLLQTGLCSLLLSCNNRPAVLQVPYYNDASFTPVWQPGQAQLDTLHRVGCFTFTDQYGAIVTERQIRGKICLSNFFFTRCAGICPRMMVNMKRIAERFKDNDQVLLLSHSVTPDKDSVGQLKAYATRNGIGGQRWLLLTGKTADIYYMARQEYFAEKEEGFYADTTTFLHTEHLVLTDARGYIRGLYNGTQAAELARITADITALLQEEGN